MVHFLSARSDTTSDEAIVRIIRQKARTFAFASRFLPAELRGPVAGLYAFCRTIDDLVDDAPADTPADVLHEQLAAWRRWLEAWPHGRQPPGPIAAALDEVIARHALPTGYLLLLIDGVASDVERTEVRTWPELRTYCFQVASTVGLGLCHLFGVGDDPAALAAAAELGVAMQLTNMLRDVGEDLRVGRVYLPADELARAGYDRPRLARLARRLEAHGPRAMDDDFRVMMAAQITRARAYYRRGLDGVPRLPRSCRLPILLAGCLYRAILAEIEAADYDVFTRRASTSRRTKLAHAARCWAAVMVPRRPDPAPSAVRFRVEDWVSS